MLFKKKEEDEYERRERENMQDVICTNVSLHIRKKLNKLIVFIFCIYMQN